MTKEIVIQERISYIATDFEVVYAIDNALNKTLRAKVNLISDDGGIYDYAEFELVSGDAYDLFGQWTDSDLRAKITEILNNI